MPVIVGDSNTSAQLTNTGIVRKGNDSNSLYAFTTWTFTPCGSTGTTGPSLSAMQSAYSSASWASNTSYLNMVGPGIQKWTVPKTGMYRIKVYGAQGGQGSDNYNSGSSTQGVPGSGIVISANFYLAINDILYILVGQQGMYTPTSVNNSDTDGGGGGGTFVAKRVASGQSQYYFNPDSSYVIPLIVAGGGGGGSSDGNGVNAVYGSWQGTTGWNNVGNAGQCLGGGFAGRVTDASIPGYSIDTYFAAGATGTNGKTRGTNFLDGGNGGNGGYSGYSQYAWGGFGGGAGAIDEIGAGGGGWLGGLNGDNTTSSSQGGTSYIGIDGTTPLNEGYNTGNGACVITYIGV
jgi:hypothetical protein